MTDFACSKSAFLVNIKNGTSNAKNRPCSYRKNGVTLQSFLEYKKIIKLNEKIMKRNLFYLLMLVCSMSVFTACGDDDDVKFPIDEEIAGTYKGTLDVELDGNPIANGIANNISITNAGDNKINMGLKDFNFMNMNLNIDIQNCEVKESGDGYTFTGSQTLSLQAPIGDCPTVVNGVVSGQKITINLDITVPGLGNQKVKVAYKGTRLTGNESSEAKILSFTFDSDIVTEQPVIDEATGKITFKISPDATSEDLRLTPIIVTSDKAVVTPASGVTQDFAVGTDVVYSVMAENGSIRKYTVSIDGMMTEYTFEDWTSKTSSMIDTWIFEVPTAGGWTGADDALGLVQSMLESSGFVVGKSLKSTTDAHSGSKAAFIETQDTKGMASIIPGVFPAIPKITSGSLFLGSFEIDAQNTLRSTRFGIPCDKKPLVVKGYYKYIPGTEYYRCDDVQNSNVAVLDNTKIDECALSAVLYEVSSFAVPEDPYDQSDERLNGTNIYTSPKIVASAQLISGAKGEYTPFELNLNYVKSYDASKLYRFAIICSSSKDGDKFCGAPGSALTIDDISVIYE